MGGGEYSRVGIFHFCEKNWKSGNPVNFFEDCFTVQDKNLNIILNNI